MNIQQRLTNFNLLDVDEQINSWEQLLLIATDFLSSNIEDKEIAFNVAQKLQGMRSIMSASKFDDNKIDLQLLDLTLAIARKTLSKTKFLKAVLNSALYYSNYYPEKYNKELIEQEIAICS